MAKKKKFFNTKVKNKRKETFKKILISTLVVILVIIGITLLIVNLPKDKGKGQKLLIKREILIEINNTMTDEMFFNTKNPKLDEVKIKYPKNFSTANIGEYNVSIIVGEQKFKSVVKVVDTTSPELVLKDVKIGEGKNYTISDFLESCKDNSNVDCDLDFYKNGVDEHGNPIKYSSYREPGVYEIKIIAKDEAGNEIIESATLTIGKGSTEQKTCEFGNNEYNSQKYVLTSSVSNGTCAINPNLYNDDNITKNVNNLLATETIRIKKDIESLKLDGTIALNRTINLVMNNNNNGLVGFEILFTATVTEDGKSKLICEYKIDNKGKRIFTSNEYNLDK